MSMFVLLCGCLLLGLLLGVMYRLHIFRPVTRVLGILCCVGAICLFVQCELDGTIHRVSVQWGEVITRFIQGFNDDTSLIDIILRSMRMGLEWMSNLDNWLAHLQTLLVILAIIIALAAVVIRVIKRLR